MTRTALYAAALLAGSLFAASALAAGAGTAPYSGVALGHGPSVMPHDTVAAQQRMYGSAYAAVHGTGGAGYAANQRRTGAAAGGYGSAASYDEGYGSDAGGWGYGYAYAPRDAGPNDCVRHLVRLNDHHREWRTFCR